MLLLKSKGERQQAVFVNVSQKLLLNILNLWAAAKVNLVHVKHFFVLLDLEGNRRETKQAPGFSSSK